jgi:hypothetical protein
LPEVEGSEHAVSVVDMDGADQCHMVWFKNFCTDVARCGAKFGIEAHTPVEFVVACLRFLLKSKERDKVLVPYGRFNIISIMWTVTSLILIVYVIILSARMEDVNEHV